jgi:hypothetical protein
MNCCRQQEIFFTVLAIVGALTLLCLAVFFKYLRKTGGHPVRGEGRSGEL